MLITSLIQSKLSQISPAELHPVRLSFLQLNWAFLGAFLGAFFVILLQSYRNDQKKLSKLQICHNPTEPSCLQLALSPVSDWIFDSMNCFVF